MLPNTVATTSTATPSTNAPRVPVLGSTVPRSSDQRFSNVIEAPGVGPEVAAWSTVIFPSEPDPPVGSIAVIIVPTGKSEWFTTRPTTRSDVSMLSISTLPLAMSPSAVTLLVVTFP